MTAQLILLAVAAVAFLGWVATLALLQASIIIAPDRDRRGHKQRGAGQHHNQENGQN